MNRREAVKYISVLMGGTMVASTALINGCRTSGKETSLKFTDADIALLDEVSDTILPDTPSSPGAKAAGVGKFMAMMVNDCYEPEDQKVFHEGIGQLNKLAQDKYKTDFVKMNPKQRLEMLVGLDNEQKESEKNKPANKPSHYFRMMKELTLLGFYTSEIGCTKAMKYVETPGSYNGDLPYKKGDKAWAIS